MYVMLFLLYLYSSQTWPVISTTRRESKSIITTVSGWVWLVWARSIMATRAPATRLLGNAGKLQSELWGSALPGL
ncbi:hypothetical protein BJ166DRAFT_68402 [Pestalotiopsis sp. NC0098]|nr:hypothetical protein BJ166DRAFT_68402 [Pestalotiopsis sp. NC0098]